MTGLKYNGLVAIALLAAAINFTSCSRGGTLESITIAPASSTITAGTTQQFTATAVFSNGTAIDWTTAAAWSSSDDAAVTIGNSFGTYGLATALLSGSTPTMNTVTITATDTANNISATATLTVVDAHPVSIVVRPHDPYMPAGDAHQFSATALLTNGTTTYWQDYTSHATWSTTDKAIATVDSTGLVKAVAPGTAEITASLETVIGSSLLTVSTGTLQSITVTPDPAFISLATPTVQFKAMGTFPDGSTPDMTQSVHWTSSNPGVATISNVVGTEKGVATAVTTTTRTTTITATDPITHSSNSVTLTVN